MAADELPQPIGDASTAGAGNAGLISSEYFSVQRSTFTPPSCAAVSVNCEVLRCSGSGALFCHAASAPQAEMVNLFNAVPTRFEKLPTAFQLMGPQEADDDTASISQKLAMHAKAPVMLSLSLPGCAESPHAYALVKAEVARHLIQMITSLQQTHAN